MVSLHRLSLTLDKVGEANESIISYEDLLSTALSESGLDLDDLFGNVPGNVLCQTTVNDSDVLCSGDSDFLDSVNVTGDFSRDNSFINFAAPNNSLLSSSFASAVPNIQVSEVEQTFLEQPPTIVASLQPFFASVILPPHKRLLNRAGHAIPRN